MKEILNVIHNTIYQFFDVCSDDEEVPMSDKDKLLLEVNKAICNNLKALVQQPCEGMRDATEEERKSTKDYINSISKPTGLQFDDIYEELDFVQPHKKISVNLQPCEDVISRESVIEWLKDKDIIKTKNQEENARRELAELPSVTPQPKTGHWITTRTFMHDGEYYCDKCKCDAPNNEKWDYCPNCGVKMEVARNEQM